MDLCAHPSVPALHGLTLGTTPVPQTALMPMFSLSKTNLHADILGIPVEGWRETPRNAATNWTDKQDDRLLWRGRNTGGFFSKAVDWRSSHRARLAAMSGDDARGWTSILPSPGSLAFDDEPERSLGNATVERSLGQLNRAMLDVGLAYEPIQCSEADNTCNEIADELTFRPVKTFEEEAGFRYILDVDGNAWSARFKRLLSTGSLVLKSSIFPEWWNDRVQPWYRESALPRSGFCCSFLTARYSSQTMCPLRLIIQISTTSRPSSAGRTKPAPRASRPLPSASPARASSGATPIGARRT
jgi:hypothetical protein